MEERSLLYCKETDEMVRVVHSYGNSFSGFVHNQFTVEFRHFTIKDGITFKWEEDGICLPFKYKKICNISPDKKIIKLQAVGQISNGFACLVISGQAYKKVQYVSLETPSSFVSPIYLKGKNEAMIQIHKKERKTLSDPEAIVTFLSLAGQRQLNLRNLWKIM